MTLHYDLEDVECDGGNVRVRLERVGASPWMRVGVEPAEGSTWIATALYRAASGPSYYEAIDNLLRLIGRARSTSATP